MQSLMPEVEPIKSGAKEIKRSSLVALVVDGVGVKHTRSAMKDVVYIKVGGSICMFG